MEDDGDVGLIGANRLWVLDRLIGKMTDRLSLQDLFYPSSFVLPWRRWCREADLIQLYNTHGGYFSYTMLPRLSRRRPVVWRLSDMWPMTGHCAYSFDCERWKTGCGSCPILSDYPALRRDRTALLWRVKQRIYQRSFLTLVAPSRWIAHWAQQSPLLGRFPVHVIPNGLDAEVFRPIPKSSAREVLGLAANRRVVLFGAHFASERRKGGQLLIEALEHFAERAEVDLELLIMGRESHVGSFPGRFTLKRLGQIRDDQLLATVYSAADVFVLPTLADNMPNGVLESMACGTPVVSFRVGGVPEAVRHMETGYLARSMDAGDLAQGLRLLLENPDLRTAMGRRSREVVEQEYSLELQAKRLLELYHEVIERHRTQGRGAS